MAAASERIRSARPRTASGMSSGEHHDAGRVDPARIDVEPFTAHKAMIVGLRASPGARPKMGRLACATRFVTQDGGIRSRTEWLCGTAATTVPGPWPSPNRIVCTSDEMRIGSGRIFQGSALMTADASAGGDGRAVRGDREGRDDHDGRVRVGVAKHLGVVPGNGTAVAVVALLLLDARSRSRIRPPRGGPDRGP